MTEPEPEPQAVLLDLLHGCWSPSSAEEELGGRCSVFVLCGASRPTGCGLEERLRGSVLLNTGCTAERLFRFKQEVDRLQLSSVRVLTSPKGRHVLQRYQKLLFTRLYHFRYGPGDSPGEGAGPEEQEGAWPEEQEVQEFLQQLPSLRGGIKVLTSPLISDCFGHGFSTRLGGVSEVPSLGSLNLFFSERRQDPVAVVMENRRRLALHQGFHPERLRVLKVNHGRVVWVLGMEEPDRYDAMVTDQPGEVLAAPGADCMMILFTDPVRRVIGVAHAGWRGTLLGVAMETVVAMTTAFGCSLSDIRVTVGPSVGVCCFTLDQNQAQDFARIHPDCVRNGGATRPHVDLQLANRILLQAGGLHPHNIEDRDQTFCTSCNPHLFFSHVRDGVRFGTQLGFLWIRNWDKKQDQD